ncbi:hypothetical protein, partial [Haloferax volcanii]
KTGTAEATPQLDIYAMASELPAYRRRYLEFDDDTDAGEAKTGTAEATPQLDIYAHIYVHIYVDGERET